MGYSIKQVRTHLGLNQKQMADKLKVHVNTYRKMEVGTRPWTVDEAAKLTQLSGYDYAMIDFQKK